MGQFWDSWYSYQFRYCSVNNSGLFIVVESIADVYKLCKETGMIDKITLGGVKSREGTRQISKAVFTTPKEEELIKELITDGVTVEIRQVPSDSVIYAKDVL